MGQIKVQRCYTPEGVEIAGLRVIEPEVRRDSRGYFVETYNYRDMAAEGLDMDFVQDNQSHSTKGVLRGLHFQKQFLFQKPFFQKVLNLFFLYRYFLLQD